MTSILNSCHPLRESPITDDAQWDLVPEQLRREISNAMKERHYPVVLTGPTGRGKSCAMAAIYRRLDCRVKWWTATEFVRLIQSCRRNGSVVLPGADRECSEESIWRVRVDQPDVLFIDDIGIRSPSDSPFEILYELINRRGSKPTVYSTNLSMKDIAAAFDNRIASRLSRGTIIFVGGLDRRTQNTRTVRVE